MPDTDNSGPVDSFQERAPESRKTEEATVDGLPVVSSVSVKHYMYPKGALIEVPGLGGVKNFGTKPVNIVQMKMYHDATGKGWPGSEGDPEDLVIEIGTEEDMEQKEVSE